ncbi:MULTISPECIES: hypothetical protein [Photorhabdus]|uniref:Uncharacterized protein n=2 Tax=Photorhabdus TaxID=29487 RepID=A0ABX0B4P9_9GAMM|nr:MULTISPECIES: hypothetical protein [Photorhabdus]MCC8467131.1 hypothetical protein [Photorhabdus bodei]MCT8353413.1 hypothetical protein [Photorhabdus kayaii]MDB6370270.1 hypothetical protein [Photorhabdus bodei]MDB6374868.1 hypothetical protein [Photorhabdus bodei]NDL14445.1 hypothetical protein [Photorhabdus kayaii]
MTGVSECSQQKGNLKDNGYMLFIFQVISLLATLTLPSHQSNHMNVLQTQIAFQSD